MKRIIFLITLLSSMASYASDIDQKYVQKTESYLNKVQNLTGKFIQSSSNGSHDSGTFWLSRPGKLKLVYNSPMEVVSDGKNLIYHDKNLDQLTHISLDAIPAGILFRSNIRLDGRDIKVLSTKKKNNYVEVTVTMAGDPGIGSLKMYFKEAPFELRGWQVKDASGLVTRITLENVETTSAKGSDFFKIKRHKVYTTDGVKDTNGFY